MSCRIFEAGAIGFALLLSSCAIPREETTKAPDFSFREVKEHTVGLARGAELFVREFGRGPTAVFLSGGPGFSGETMLETARVWTDHRRILLPDQRGTGQSSGDFDDPEEWTIEQAVDDLERLRIAAQVDEWDLVGHSWGGLLAMAYTAAHPDRVSALVLISPAGIRSDFWMGFNQNIMRRLTKEQRKELRSLRPADDSLDAMADLIVATNRAQAPAYVFEPRHVERLRADLAPETFSPHVLRLMTPALLQYDFSQSLKDFSGRCLVIQGDHDAIGRPAIDLIVESIPGSELEIIEECGHVPTIERPEILEAILLDFVEPVAAISRESSRDTHSD